MAENLGICDKDSMTNCRHLSYHQNPLRKNCSHNTPVINKPAKRGRHSLRKQSKYAYGSIQLSRYMSYNKGFHAPALMEGSILWRSTSWSCPNLPSWTTNHQKNEVNQKNNKTKNGEWEWESKPSIPIYDLSYFWSKFFNLQ